MKVCGQLDHHMLLCSRVRGQQPHGLQAQAVHLDGAQQRCNPDVGLVHRPRVLSQKPGHLWRGGADASGKYNIECQYLYHHLLAQELIRQLEQCELTSSRCSTPCLSPSPSLTVSQMRLKERNLAFINHNSDNNEL